MCEPSALPCTEVITLDDGSLQSLVCSIQCDWCHNGSERVRSAIRLQRQIMWKRTRTSSAHASATDDEHIKLLCFELLQVHRSRRRRIRNDSLSIPANIHTQRKTNTKINTSTTHPLYTCETRSSTHWQRMGLTGSNSGSREQKALCILHPFPQITHKAHITSSSTSHQLHNHACTMAFTALSLHGCASTAHSRRTHAFLLRFRSEKDKHAPALVEEIVPRQTRCCCCVVEHCCACDSENPAAFVELVLRSAKDIVPLSQVPTDVTCDFILR